MRVSGCEYQYRIPLVYVHTIVLSNIYDGCVELLDMNHIWDTVHLTESLIPNNTTKATIDTG